MHPHNVVVRPERGRVVEVGHDQPGGIADHFAALADGRDLEDAYASELDVPVPVWVKRDRITQQRDLAPMKKQKVAHFVRRVFERLPLEVEPSLSCTGSESFGALGNTRADWVICSRSLKAAS
jgi:hypothetical protein